GSASTVVSDTRGVRTKSLAGYAVATIVVALAAWAATVTIGLPDWVFPGSLIVMALGLLVILFTGSVRHAAYALAAFVLLVGASMLLRVMGIGPAGSLLAAGRIKARDPLLVTDFKVTNADTTLGRVLSEAAKTQLAQSPVITLLPADAVADAL